MATKQRLLFHLKYFAALKASAVFAALVFGLASIFLSEAASFRSLSQVAVPRVEHTAPGKFQADPIHPRQRGLVGG